MSHPDQPPDTSGQSQLYPYTRMDLRQGCDPSGFPPQNTQSQCPPYPAITCMGLGTPILPQAPPRAPSSPCWGLPKWGMIHIEPRWCHIPGNMWGNDIPLPTPGAHQPHHGPVGGLGRAGGCRQCWPHLQCVRCRQCPQCSTSCWLLLPPPPRSACRACREKAL